MVRSPPATLRLVTLGRCAVERHASGTTRETVFGPGKPLAVLAFLAAAPHRVARREQLLDLLWGDADPDKARNSLRQVIWLLRSRLGDDVLSAESDRIALHAAVTTDRDQFLSAINAGDPAAALAVYGGTFLPDLATPGGAEFEHWADVERQYLHSAYVRAAELRIRQLLDAGRAHQAVEVAEVLRSREPLREASWRLLIEALLADHNALGATAQADGLLRMLRAEGREPEPASRRLLLRCDTPPGPAGHDRPAAHLVAELVGREAEFSAAMRLWREAAQGRARHLHLSGEAGLGKSRLLADVTARIRAQGGRVALVRGRAGERHVAWMIASDLARALAELPGAAAVSPAAAGALVAMEPSLALRYPGAADPGGADDDLVRRRAGALRELIAAVALDAPLALALDDIHWMDLASAEAITLALTRIGERPVLVISASRPTPAAAPLAPADVAATLAPLSPAQIAELLASLGALRQDPWVHDFLLHLHQTTDGNPLLVLETLTALIGRDLLRLDDQTWTTPDPDALLHAALAPVGFAERVARLAPPARAALDALAVAPIPLGTAPLGRALAHEPAALLPILHSLDRDGLVVRRDEAWEPSHDRVRDRLLGLMSAERRNDLERRIGEAAAQDAEVPARLLPAFVPGLVQSGDPADLERAYLRWVDSRRGLGDARSARALTLAFLGALASPPLTARLLRARPVVERVGGRPAIAVALVVAALGGAWGFNDWATRPTQLALVQRPIGYNVGIVPVPIVEIQDRFGRRVRSATDTVEITVTHGPPLRGDTVRNAVAGRASFPGLSFGAEWDSTDTVTLQLRSPRLPARDVALPLGLGDVPLDLTDVTLNGRTLELADPVVHAHPGDSVSGTVSVRYTSRWGAAAVMLGAVATWMPREHGVLAQLPLVTPIDGGTATLKISFQAPRRPGTYHVIVAFDAEPDIKWLASGTNWTVGHTIWGDGNDFQEWTDSMYSVSRRKGLIKALIIRPHVRIPGYQYIPSRVIDLVVE